MASFRTLNNAIGHRPSCNKVVITITVHIGPSDSMIEVRIMWSLRFKLLYVEQDTTT